MSNDNTNPPEWYKEACQSMYGEIIQLLASHNTHPSVALSATINMAASAAIEMGVRDEKDFLDFAKEAWACQIAFAESTGIINKEEK
jgi:3-dehydroquinate dehydratase